MKQYRNVITISVTFFFVLFFDNFSYTQNNIIQNQLLWKISGNGLKKDCFLYGSYHTNDTRVFNFPDSLYFAFLQSDILALEADVNPLFLYEDIRKTIPKFRFDINGRIFTADKKSTKTKYGTEDGRPQFLDMHFQSLAQNMNKPCFFLETIEEQLEVFENIYEESTTDIKLEEYALKENKFMNAYLRGNIEELRLLVENDLRNSPNAYDRIINERNLKIVNKLDSLFKKKSTLTIVGAAHLSGQQGIIQLLKSKGYHVKPVKTTYLLSKEQINKNIFPFYSKRYFDEKYNFSAIFGSKPYIDSSTNVYRVIYAELGQGNTYIIEIENVKNIKLKKIINDVMINPEESKIYEVRHQDTIQAFEGVGYENYNNLCWKRILYLDGKLIKLICYGGNKFMLSNRPKNFFNSVEFKKN